MEKNQDSCPHCGRRMEGPEADPDLHVTVMRVVRPGHRYGPGWGARPGERVLVEVREADHPSVVGATMSLEEAELSEAGHASRGAPAEPGNLARMVEAGMEAARARVRASIDQGRRAEDWASRRAAERATA